MLLTIIRVGLTVPIPVAITLEWFTVLLAVVRLSKDVYPVFPVTLSAG